MWARWSFQPAFKILDPATKELFGYGRFPDVVTGPQMDRLLAPTRPYNAVLRPSDGKEPENIAILLCVGSRDQHGLQSALLPYRLHVLDETCATRHGRSADWPTSPSTRSTFALLARVMTSSTSKPSPWGLNSSRARLREFEQLPNGNLALHYEDMLGEGGMKTREHDLVVLTVGFLPNTDAFSLYKGGELAADNFGLCARSGSPVSKHRHVPMSMACLAAGATIGVMDIPDTVLHSGAAAAQAAVYLQKNEGRGNGTKTAHRCLRLPLWREYLRPC